MKSINDNPIVYSTETGRVAPKDDKILLPARKSIIRLERQTAGRHGKVVIVIHGISQDKADLSTVATQLKKHCGCGGSIKDDRIEIQGDKRELIQCFLEKKGYRIK